MKHEPQHMGVGNGVMVNKFVIVTHIVESLHRYLIAYMQILVYGI
jgi:hypothetical protein